MQRLILYLGFLLCLTLTCNVGLAAPVMVSGGQVEGQSEDSLMVYRGIPFAAPPVDVWRWQPPQPVIPWDGVLQAVSFGDGCIQGMPDGDGGFAANVSEDCLYLNVWTPATSPDERLPVMVWIYGGGFSFGSTSTPLYSGEQLARRGVVVVSVAYRVGPMGFMAHQGLSAENQLGPHRIRASGNHGLLDQIAGLEWVQENIAAFGGDPQKVTVFGESAGGISVSMLAASPLAKDLFHRVISQSGGSFGPTRTPSMPGENIPSLEDAEAGGEALGEKINAPTIATMRQKTAAEIQLAATGVNGVGWPILDGWVIPGDQYELYATGQYNDTPILVGINSDEGATFSRTVEREAFLRETRERYGPFFADKLLAAYPADADGSIVQGARDMIRDAAFGWHTWVWAKLQTEQGGSPAFVYYFDQRPPYPADSPQANIRGAPHAAELGFVFGHLAANRSWSDADHALSDAIISYWTSFAKTGNPSAAGLPEWPMFEMQKQMRMVFHDRPLAMPYDNISQLETLDEYFAWRRTDEGKNFVQKD